MPPDSTSSTSCSVKVVCRFRPQNQLETKEGGSPCIEIDDLGTTVRLSKGKDPSSTPFAFDRIFGWNFTQRQIFDYSVKSIVDDVVAGYNGTVFAYGQTGSGKTYTMMGSGTNDEEGKGITPRIVENIFSAIINSPSTMEYTVKVAYMEIYMERIRDLLNPTSDNLPIHEEKSRGVYVKGLLEVYVSSVDEVFEVMRRGGQARMVAHTNMNAESSRSHSIFVVTISQKNLVDGSVKAGRLFLVDLAGSEKVGKTGASGQTLEEAKKINKSLSALGMVINALTDGKSTHIPYRDSKLTRILQESLGGNSRTTLIINCSPSSWNAEETISTLRFGTRAKSIKNKAKVNQELSAAELKTLLRKAKTEAISFQQYARALEGEVEIWRTGGTVPKEKQVTRETTNLTTSLNQASSVQQNLSTVNPFANSPTSNDLHSTSSSEITISQASTISSASLPKQLFTTPLPEYTSRSTTPALVSALLSDEEREEYLRRENELMDQLSEKETSLANKEKALEAMREEMKEIRDWGNISTKENKEMSSALSDLQNQLERVTYENKELAITIDTLRETNTEVTAEVEDVKAQMREMNERQNAEEEKTKEAKKKEKMVKMMAELDPSGALEAQEAEFGKTIARLAELDVNAAPETQVVLTIGEVSALRKQLDEARSAIESSEDTVAELLRENEILTTRRDECEVRLAQLEAEYEDMLDKTIAEEEAGQNIDIVETIQELRSKLEAQYASKAEQHKLETENLRQELERRNEEFQQSVAELDVMKRRVKEPLIGGMVAATNEAEQETCDGDSKIVSESTLAEKERELERIQKTMAQQFADFEVMKRALMRDLQHRCEKVVELEMALDETREQYNAAVKAVNSKAQQKKMAFLERNLEQLTNVQKQLVEQNASLKKDMAVAERKLAARNDRIQSLEGLLQDTQERSKFQQQKFEGQLEAVKDRLEQVRAQKQQSAFSGLGLSGLTYGRIAKPLRGGGAASIDVENNFSVTSEDATTISNPGTPMKKSRDTGTETPTLTPVKRGSWLGWRTSTS